MFIKLRPHYDYLGNISSNNRCTGAYAPVQRPAGVDLPHCRTVRCTIQQAEAPDTLLKIKIFPEVAGVPQAVMTPEADTPKSPVH